MENYWARTNHLIKFAYNQKIGNNWSLNYWFSHIRVLWLWLSRLKIQWRSSTGWCTFVQNHLKCLFLSKKRIHIFEPKREKDLSANGVGYWVLFGFTHRIKQSDSVRIVSSRKNRQNEWKKDTKGKKKTTRFIIWMGN